MANLSGVVVSLKAQRERAEKTVAALNDLGYKLSTKSRRQARGLRTMSAAARRRISRYNALAGPNGKPPRRKAEGVFGTLITCVGAWQLRLINPSFRTYVRMNTRSTR